MASATSTLACGKEASEWDGDHKTKQCPFSTLLWSPTHTCSYDTMLQNIKNTILQKVLNSWLDGVRTSCRAVDGGTMKSAKFMRRIIRICHAPLTTKAPEKFERLVASPRSSLVVKKTKPRKTSNMMHVTGMKVKKMHFWMRVVENPSADSVKGGNVSTEQKGLLVLFFFMGGPSSTLLLASAATLCWKRNCWQQVFLMTFLWPYQLHAMGAKCTWKSDQLSM